MNKIWTTDRRNYPQLAIPIDLGKRLGLEPGAAILMSLEKDKNNPDLWEMLSDMLRSDGQIWHGADKPRVGQSDLPEVVSVLFQIDDDRILDCVYVLELGEGEFTYRELASGETVQYMKP